MAAWIIWLIIAALLVIAEVLSQMIWALCFATGCICAAIASLFGVSVAWQIGITAVASLLSFPILIPWFRKMHKRSHADHDLRTGMDALLGRRATVTVDILPGAIGRVQIDGDNWQARTSASAQPLRKGAEAIVTDYDSIVLTVTPANH